MAARLSYSENTFSPAILIPMIETYAYEWQDRMGSRTWVPDLFIHVKFSFETIVANLQNLWYNDKAPFVGRAKVVIAQHLVYVCQKWYEDCLRNNRRFFGSEDIAAEITDLLQHLAGELDLSDDRDVAQELIRKIERSYL
jgi:nuclear pore complex protein Nup155